MLAVAPRLVCLLLTVLAGLAPPALAAGEPRGKGTFAAPPEALLSVAEQKVQAQKYDEAIVLYRRYLRRSPKDYKAWSKLGAAYFFSGQPRKALKNLKHAEHKLSDKGFNYYYQGLCYEQIGLTARAHDYLQYAAAKSKDEWGAKAAFEVGVLEYKARQKDKALYWFNQYLKLAPKGQFEGEARRLLVSLADDRWVDDAKGAALPDTEKALFRYSKLSFSPKPHYWFLSGGAKVTSTEDKEPDQGGKLKDGGSSEEAALFNMGAGIGPLRYGNATITSGYTYKQIWHTDDDRVQEWLADLGDILYFPLRSDLLERKHQVFFDLRYDLGSSYFFGVYARYELGRIGSSVFPNPEIDDLQQVIPVSDTQLLIPWFGFAYNANMRTLAYLYMRKEINDNQAAYSNETFSTEGDDGKPTFSLGVSHTMDLPEYETTLDFELYFYQFVYNDKFLDYGRTGFFASAENRLFLSLTASLLVGYYSDAYVRDQPKAAGACGANPNIVPNADGTAPPPGRDIKAQPVTCERNDTGLLLQAGAAWNFSQYNRLDGYVQIVQNTNDTLEEYSETKTTIQVAWTMAFPSVKRVSRIVDRYADSAFTKEPK